MAHEINRIIDANGICTYLDEDVQEAAFVLELYGFDLEGLDSFLESLPKSKRLNQFLEWRSHALHAIKIYNESAAEGWCSALNASRFEYMRSSSLIPLAEYGIKSKEEKSKGGNTKRDNDKDGKQTAKVAIENEFNKWYEVRGKGRWKASFARKMLDSFPVIENQKSIENWAQEWMKKKN